MSGAARYLSICPKHKVGLVSGLASLPAGHLPAPLERQASQHAGFAATYGAGSQGLLSLVIALRLGGMPQVPSMRTHLGEQEKLSMTLNASQHAYNMV